MGVVSGGLGFTNVLAATNICTKAKQRAATRVAGARGSPIERRRLAALKWLRLPPWPARHWRHTPGAADKCTERVRVATYLGVDERRKWITKKI